MPHLVEVYLFLFYLLLLIKFISPLGDSPVIPEKNESDQSFSKPNYSTTESSVCRPNNSNVTMKHVTAAVIPTAPKRDIHPELTTLQDPCAFVKEQKTFCPDSCVKTELVELSAEKKNVIPASCNNILLGKNTLTNSKVKDMIKNVCAVKQVCTEKPLLKNDETETNKLSSPKAVVTLELSASVSPMVALKSNSNTQYVPTNSSPFDEGSPVLKSETTNSRQDCEFTQKSNWTRATVPPFSWQSSGITQDDQAMNLTVSKKLVKPEPTEMLAISELPEALQSNSKITSENCALSNSGIVGVCHPNPSTIAVSKMKVSPAVSSISNFASISVLNQPTEQSTEVHILHRSSKSSFPVLNQNRASPVPLKSTISHVTANTSIHRALKTERLLSKRGKINEMDKMNHGGRTTLATLAPKLAKNVNFGKDIQTSHTISASSSVSSTSIVFPATGNVFNLL